MILTYSLSLGIGYAGIFWIEITARLGLEKS